MECLRPITLHVGTPDERTVPCGKCIHCLANRRAEWIIRLRAENACSDFGLFVTLTKDDAHQHYVEVFNQDTGEVKLKQAPNKREIQLFLKRLRKVIGKEHMRYFIISEYGDRTQRCHYHGLFFFKGIAHDKALYDKIESAWSAGFVSFGDITPASITYCTKYALKLTETPYGIKDNFMLCSRRPAIGSQVLMKQMKEENISLLNSSRIHLHGVSARLPRLFRNKLQDYVENDLKQDFEEFKLSTQEQLNKHRLEVFKSWKQTHKDGSMYEFLEFLEQQNTIKARQMQYRIKQQNSF